MTLADEIKKITEEALNTQRTEKAAKKAAEAEEILRQCGLASQQVNAKFPEVLEAIKEAAKNGKNYYSISIYQWASDTRELSVEYATAKEYKKLLTEAGFSFKDCFHTMESNGSDPVFYDAVESYSIMVQW